MRVMNVKFVGRIIMTILFVFICIGAYAGDDLLKYEIEGEGVGVQGTYLVKVTVIQKKSKLDIDVIKKCAVHGVLFKGFSSQTSRTRQKPLAGSMVIEQQHQDYFDVFFQKGGSYINFANMIGENLSVVKMGKQYRISAVVSVAKDALYQELVSAGVIKGLNNGFQLMYKRLIVTFLILAGALLPAFAQQAHEVFYLNNGT